MLFEVKNAILMQNSGIIFLLNGLSSHLLEIEYSPLYVPICWLISHEFTPAEFYRHAEINLAFQWIGELFEDDQVKVCKFKVKGKKHQSFGFCGSSGFNIGLSCQASVRSSEDIMSCLLKVWLQMARNIFVEFDFMAIY